MLLSTSGLSDDPTEWPADGTAGVVQTDGTRPDGEPAQPVYLYVNYAHGDESDTAISATHMCLDDESVYLMNESVKATTDADGLI